MTSADIFSAVTLKYMDENCGIPTDTLMETAAKRLLECLGNRKGGKICIACGKGNNGGDGYALGVLLLKQGADTVIFAVDEPVSPLAIKYRNLYANLGGALSCDIDAALANADTVVDCIFGFSFKGEAVGKYAAAINAINKSNAFVLAADVPSGLTADSDTLPEVCIKADITCTFTAKKLALSSYPSKAICGEVLVADIGIPAELLKKQAPLAITANSRLLKLLPNRKPDGHKGTFGTLAALCGSENMCGAAYMATLGALRSGVGLVRLYTSKESADILRIKLNEPVICSTVTTKDILYRTPNALLLGCGCGREYDKTINELVKYTDIPAIIDADGINALEDGIQLHSSDLTNRVITPHPAELARLIKSSTDKVNSNRTETALATAKAFKAVTVLKGACTVIAAPDGRVCVSPYCNTGLAKGGSGDVLAGLIGSLLAQGVLAFEAACLGVYLHGVAAERVAACKGIYAMLPSDLPEEIGKIMYFG